MSLLVRFAVQEVQQQEEEESQGSSPRLSQHPLCLHAQVQVEGGRTDEGKH